MTSSQTYIVDMTQRMTQGLTQVLRDVVLSRMPECNAIILPHMVADTVVDDVADIMAYILNDS
jgi:hypothetical protein